MFKDEATARAYHRAYYLSHRDVAISRAAKWAKEHPEQTKANKKKSALKPENKQRKKEYDARWRREINPEASRRARKRCRSQPESKEKSRIAWKKWSSENREHLIKYRADHKAEKVARKATRRAREKGGQVGSNKSLAIFYCALKEAKSVLCYWCHEPIEGVRCGDHYIPLDLGGDHKVNNLVPSCVPCNLRKHAKTPDDFLGELLAERKMKESR